MSLASFVLAATGKLKDDWVRLNTYFGLIKSETDLLHTTDTALQTQINALNPGSVSAYYKTNVLNYTNDTIYDGTTSAVAATNLALADMPIGGTLYFPYLGNGRYLVDSSLSLASYPNITLEFEPGAILDIADTKTLTLENTKIVAGLCQCFELNSTGIIAGTWDVKECCIEWFGAISNDIDRDCTPILQTATNMCSIAGGGTIRLKSGKYYFKGTYAGKSSVNIIGAVDSTPWNGNASVGTDNGTVFYHIPDSSIDFITLDPADKLVGYVGNVNIKNIYIIGNSNSNIGIYSKAQTVSVFENISIQGFNNNIQIEFAMNISFNRVTSQQARNNCLYITGGLSTTITFSKCYFGQIIANPTARPLNIGVYTVLGAYFNDCIIESCETGCLIDSANVVAFNNIYTENVPATTINPTIEIGNSVPPSSFNGSTNFNGGIIMGTNGNIVTNMTLISAKYTHALAFVGIAFMRANYLINTTGNSKGVTFVSCNETQITFNLEQCNIDKRITYLNQTAGSTTITQKAFVPWDASVSLVLQNGWSIYTTGLVYRKNNLNIVSLELSLTAGTNATGTIIATLPEGFRPKLPTFVPLFNLSDAVSVGLSLVIYDSGNITVSSLTSIITGKVYIGTIMFYAYN